METNKIYFEFDADEKPLEAALNEASKDMESFKKEVDSSMSGTSSAFKQTGNVAESFRYQLVKSASYANAAYDELKNTLVGVAGSFAGAKVLSAPFSIGLDAIKELEQAEFSLRRASKATGESVAESFQAVSDASSSLMTTADTTRAISNLVAFGYSAQEAATMVQNLTDISVAQRDAQYTVAEAVLKTTEGIKKETSLKIKASGITSTLSDMYQRYADQLGITADEVERLYKNEAIAASISQTAQQYQGSAAAYTNTLNGSLEALSVTIQELKTAIGQTVEPLAIMGANALTQAGSVKTLAAYTADYLAILIGSGGLLAGASKVTTAINSLSMAFNGTAVTAKTAILGLSKFALAATAVLFVINALYQASTRLQNQITDAQGQVASSREKVNSITEQIASTEKDLANARKNLTTNTVGATGATKDYTKALQDLEFEYLQDLKRIETNHKETIDNLTKQIQEANVDYRRAIDERNAEFAVSQAQEEKKHQEKVDELMTQIDFLQRYNNEYNRQKLTNLQLALARENNLYAKQTQAAKEELDLQNENDRKAYEEKRAQLQAELDQEMAFMDKHREDLVKVQEVILLDEIEALNRRHEAQIKSYEEQAASAAVGGASIAESYWGAYVEETEKKLDELKKQLADAMQEYEDALDLLNQLNDEKDYAEGKSKERAQAGRKYTRRSLARYGAYHGYASGGYTGKGAADEVAGIVHRGEYVIPKEDVDQNTGTPKLGGNTYITVNLSGTFATSAAERRKVADQIVAAINQNNKSRLEAAWQ